MSPISLAGAQIEALHRALDHTLCRQYLGLTDCRRRLDIDDDRVVDVDQVVGRIGEEGRSTVRGGPPRRGIGRRNELRRHLAGRPERRVVEDRQILLDRTPSRFRWQARSALDAVAVAGVGLDQAGVNSKAFTADQAFVDAALQHALEQPSQQIAFAKAAMPVLREGRMVGHRAIEPEPTEPPVGEVEVDLFTQPPLRADAEAVADNHHPDHQFGIHRRPADVAVERRQLSSQATEFDEPVDRPQQMPAGYRRL